MKLLQVGKVDNVLTFNFLDSAVVDVYRLKIRKETRNISGNKNHRLVFNQNSNYIAIVAACEMICGYLGDVIRVSDKNHASRAGVKSTDLPQISHRIRTVDDYRIGDEK